MSITAPRLWLDGKLVSKQEAVLPFLSHAVQRGSAVFDVGSFHRTNRGVGLFRAPEHVARLLASCRTIGLDVRFDEETLVDAACGVVRACGDSEGMVRWSAVFDAPESDFTPRSLRARIVVAAQLFEDPPRTTPIRVVLFDDARKQSPASLPASAKVAAAYLGPLVHRRRAQEAGADEIILLDEEGFVAEAPTANVFAVIGGTLVTPPVDRILSGITRDTVLEMARREGLLVREERLTRTAFESADEAFLSSSAAPITEIKWVNSRKLPGGPITPRIQALRDAAVHGANPAWIRLV